MPPRILSPCVSKGTPEEITPHAKAHMGGNQVMGLSNSAMTLGCGSRIRSFLHYISHCQYELTLIFNVFQKKYNLPMTRLQLIPSAL